MEKKKGMKVRTRNELCEVKRGSINRERVSSASIIGLHVAFGNPILVKKPSKVSHKTLPHIKIEKTMLGGYDIMESVDQTTFSLLDKRSKEATILNLISHSFATLVNGKSAKRKPSFKTEKLNIFESIEPFTSLGFCEFGKKVIDVIMKEDDPTHTKRHQFVQLDECDKRILQVLNEVVTDKNYVSENGSDIVAMINTYADKIAAPTELADRRPLQNTEKTINMSKELEFWNCQKINTYNYKTLFDSFAEQVGQHGDYMRTVGILNLVGMIRKEDVDKLCDPFEFLESEFKAVSSQFQQYFDECSRIEQEIQNSLLSADENKLEEIEQMLHFTYPLYMNSLIQSFRQLFSIGNIHLGNDNTSGIIQKARQEKVVSEVERHKDAQNTYLGKELMDILVSENRTTDSVPIHIEILLTYLYDYCYDSPNIFAPLSSDDVVVASQILRMLQVIDMNQLSPHLLAGALKMFLCQIPGRLINKTLTHSLIEQWSSIPKPISFQMFNKTIRNLLNTCLPQNLTLLKYTFKLFSKVNAFSQTNKTNEFVIAKQFSEVVFDVEESVQEKAQVLEEIVCFIVLEFKHFFPEDISDTVLMLEKDKKKLKEFEKNTQKEREGRILQLTTMVPPPKFLAQDKETRVENKGSELLNEIQQYIINKKTRKMQCE
ncbi:hypothetical protein EIN_320430 [Entamoeba invadens IP1]|uniref:Rho-GAP domain-containing protein n=1 Tax=Entamoeba invadens IP1 TaxID=370355 RepID=A0A0A1TZP9_ENTIV|nr:hypothetical protein EIN_320430 [Entamoeba invadens IP1]ELP87044.1 hypothetical protein EIN_320430 [Entamoeba invadens IP1]|eukprot:XP_004253815.1 hypothetical protein EIN_320430 [Entamoeba invadens IP1]